MKAFLKAGILTEDGTLKDTDCRDPAGRVMRQLRITHPMSSAGLCAALACCCLVRGGLVVERCA